MIRNMSFDHEIVIMWHWIEGIDENLRLSLTFQVTRAAMSHCIAAHAQTAIEADSINPNLLH